MLIKGEEAPCDPENIGSVKCFANKRSLVRSFAESIANCGRVNLRMSFSASDTGVEAPTKI